MQEVAERKRKLEVSRKRYTAVELKLREEFANLDSMEKKTNELHNIHVRFASVEHAHSNQMFRSIDPCPSCVLTYSNEKVANRNGRDFGWEIAHAAVSRRPPISLYTIVAHTEGYTYAAKVWDLSIVQGQDHFLSPRAKA